MLVDLAAELRDCSLLRSVLVNQFIVFLYCNLDLAFEINHKYGSIQSLRWTLNRMLHYGLNRAAFKKPSKMSMNLNLLKKEKKVFDTILSEFLLHLKKLYFPNIPAFIKVIFLKIASMTDQFPCWSVYSVVWNSTWEFNSKSTINWSARVAKTKLACIPNQCTSNQMVHSSNE